MHDVVIRSSDESGIAIKRYGMKKEKEVIIWKSTWSSTKRDQLWSSSRYQNRGSTCCAPLPVALGTATAAYADDTAILPDRSVPAFAGEPRLHSEVAKKVENRN